MTPPVARVIQLIETTLTVRGTGEGGNGIRRVTQYWSLAGELLWESDPQVTGKGEIVYASPPAASPPNNRGKKKEG